MASADRDALIALYRSADGSNWRKKTNWDTDVHVSKWHGVNDNVNDNGQGRVVQLFLHNNKLRGISRPVPTFRISHFAFVRCLWPLILSRNCEFYNFFLSGIDFISGFSARPAAE